MRSNSELLFKTYLFVALLCLMAINSCDVSQSSEKGDNGEEVVDSSGVSLEDKLVVRYMNLKTDKKGGDAIIIKTPDGHIITVDAGRTSVGSQVNQYLNDLDIQTVDYAIATHPHIDHIGGYLNLIDTKQIDKFLMPNVTHTASYYEELINGLEEKEISQEYLEEGDRLTFDNEIEIEVFSPPKGTTPPNSTTIQAINDLSIVLKLTYGDASFLFTGDINMNREGKLIESHGEELSADMLHAPHHGKDTSSSLNFIQAVAPKIVVISANNTTDIEETYVYQRYKNFGSDIYVTGRDGHVTLVSDGEQIEVNSNNKRIILKHTLKIE